MKTAIILGTRPEIIKFSPIIKKLRKKDCTVIFTGQHYDYDMSLRFMDDLELPAPDYKIKLTKLQNTTTDRATQTGEIILNLAKIITDINPDTVLVQGDTNTVLAAGITSLKCSIPISHIESGLRSNDWRMPEEHNRIAIDHISELLFAPTKDAKKNLIGEKVHGKIHISGNTSIDSIENCISQIGEKSIFIPIFDEYALVTLHRGENVDDKKTLASIIHALINSKYNLVFPIHPRTLKQIKKFGFYNKLKNSSNIQLIPPQGYFEMIKLMKNCTFIISDSGGIQEEATSPSIRKKVLVIRKTTDRPESVNAGFAELVGTDTNSILKAMKKLGKNISIPNSSAPYGKGNASEKIIKILRKNF
jgi:UDP-N-acetylglucosamine 2-epimerase (non-hydrolysing)